MAPYKQELSKLAIINNINIITITIIVITTIIIQVGYLAIIGEERDRGPLLERAQVKSFIIFIIVIVVVIIIVSSLSASVMH